ncbi:MBL fold metallo-hydrolase, partial [bacterium]|nr:MBL fold metallo-hydrolase [bacterium]
MDITWLGQSCFKIQGKETTLVIDPYDSKLGIKLPKKLEADILLISHDHYDHNNKEAVSGDPYIINTPGEYEVKGVQITGIEMFHDKNQGKDRGKTTAYVIELDGIKLCHLGDIGQDLSDEEIEKLGDIDVLMIPTGGVYTINAEEAAKIIGEIEPKISIPMHYKIPCLVEKLDTIDKFTDKVKTKTEKS